MPRQTVAQGAELAGHGLFNGRACRIEVRPAPAGAGITFSAEGSAVRVPARHAFRQPAQRRTVLGQDGHTIETVEHFLAAAYALRIDDLDVIVSGGEIPVADGSFMPFVELLRKAGTRAQQGRRRRLVLEREIGFAHGESEYSLQPADALRLDVSLEFAQPVIGRQRSRLAVSPETFVTEIAPARTFGFVAEIERSRQHGSMLGARDGCGIALEAERVVNTTLRWPDEFARHKAGDLIGDLALVGAPLAAAVTVSRPSHEGNFACVQAILDAARYVEE